MLRRESPRFFYFIGALVLLLASLPYLYAWRVAGEMHVFSGLLYNPLDGASYLAKMRQGWEGAWRYRLAFTAEPGEGAFLFLYYLFLGHLARFLHLPIPLTYHLARLAGTAALLYALDAFYAAYLPPRARKTAFAFAALGSGMGWLALPFGLIPTDFSVPEAYPFLSAYVNPHFPLGLALALLLLIPRPPEKKEMLLDGWISLLLAVISPFGMVLVLLVRGGLALGRVRVPPRWSALEEGFRSLLPLVAGGLPYLLYTQWAVRADPLLAAWNAQNLTPAAPWWDVLLAFSPLLPLALWSLRGRERPSLLWVWVTAAFLLLYAPLSLQRRFLMGVYVPLAGLGALALTAWDGARRRLAVALAGALAAPTVLLILLTVLSFPAAPPPELYLTRAEADVLNWIAANTPPESVVLASPQLSVFIPAFAGRGVVYGHPFETVEAEAAEAAVLHFFAGSLTPADLPYLVPADYLLIGPRERALGAHPPPSPPLCRRADVALWPYSVPRTAYSVPRYPITQFPIPAP
ncbi:MAG TPA: hypothetical protein ENJ02_05550, partial [Chloroflexi bacterium]|nr:hypothetical protein [Chloroflexota bacterium]